MLTAAKDIDSERKQPSRNVERSSLEYDSHTKGKIRLIVFGVKSQHLT